MYFSTFASSSCMFAFRDESSVSLALIFCSLPSISFFMDSTSFPASSTEALPVPMLTSSAFISSPISESFLLRTI